MEVGLEGCLDMLMLCACCLLLCTLKKTHTPSSRCSCGEAEQRTKHVIQDYIKITVFCVYACACVRECECAPVCVRECK